MKVGVFYYSLTGNTRLVCERLLSAAGLGQADLIDILKAEGSAPSAYDILGFATFADELRLPNIMRDFIRGLAPGKERPCFAVVSYGSLPGKTKNDLIRLLAKKSFSVLGGLSVHMPENYPPMIRLGLGFKDQPSERQRKKLEAFAKRLADQVKTIQSQGRVKRVRGNPLLAAIPLPGRFLSRVGLGRVKCDSEKCVLCGKCVEGCPAKAIALTEGIVVDEGKCQKCWRCYNLCPVNAIYGTRFRGGYQYKPLPPLRPTDSTVSRVN